MRLATLKHIALGTVFAASLMGCVSEEPQFLGPESSPIAGAPDGFSATNLDSELAQARAERRGGDLNMATQTLARLMLMAPDDPLVLGEYGKTLIAEGRSREALGFLERAVELKPGEWSLHSARGVAYDLTGNHLEAQAAYERALLVKPGEPTVLSNNAMSHMELGDLDTAEKLLQQASRSVADPRIKQNLAMVQGMRNGRTPASMVAMADMVAVAEPVDVALQPNMMMLDAAPSAEPAPEMDAAPEMDLPPMMAAPEAAPEMSGPEALWEDQATRGQSVDFDEVFAEGLGPPVSSPAKLENPKNEHAAAAKKSSQLKAGGDNAAKSARQAALND